MVGLRMDRRRFLQAGAAAAGGLMLVPHVSRAQTAGMQKIAIASTSGDSGQTLIELMQSQGFLKKFDLEPEFLSVSDGAKIVSAIVSGSADICRGSGFGQTLAAINQGAEMKVIGGACVLITQAIYTARPEIKTLKDLEGRVVGAGAPGALLHHMTSALLKKHGVDVSKVQFVNVGSSTNVFKAVVAGTVDAGPGLTNVYDEQAKYGVHAIADFWTELPDYPYQACYAATKAIDEKRDVLVRALAGFQSLYDFVQSDSSKDVYVQAAMKATGDTEPSKSIAQWEFFNKYKPFSIVMPPERIDYLQGLNVDAGIQQAPLPLDRIADFSLAQDALKLIG